MICSTYLLRNFIGVVDEIQYWKVGVVGIFGIRERLPHSL